MATSKNASTDQETYWNGRGSDSWITLQELLDATFIGFTKHLESITEELSPRDLLDIGCGTGSTTLAAARVKGKAGSCHGLDISKPMLKLANERAAKEKSPVEFIHGDAQHYKFPQHKYDLLISRFGVMFFSDNLAAFSNLRRATGQNGQTCFVAWRTADENEFLSAAERAAAPFFPDLEPRRDNVPGPLGLADRDRTQAILEKSGWAHVNIAPLDIECRFPKSKLVDYITLMGPLGQYLKQRPGDVANEAMEAVKAAYDKFIVADDVVFNAACWEIRAKAD